MSSIIPFYLFPKTYSLKPIPYSMLQLNFQILPTALLETYESVWDSDALLQFEILKEAEISTETFSFYTSVASVYSNKIEGEEIDLDSYIKHKKFGASFKPDYTKKIDDLYNAYTFAKKSTLNRKNVEKAHALLAKNFVAKHQLGKIRTQNMYVTTSEGKIEYVAASPFQLEAELEKFYSDVDILFKNSLTISESFFFASLIHLVFVKIHPFIDGNGRTARLLEKWFLAQKLGDKAWFVQSEKYYYTMHQTYYNNLRAWGLEYESLDYSKALPFLLTLNESLKN